MNNFIHFEFDHISRFDNSELSKFSDDWCESIKEPKRRKESQLARLLLNKSCIELLNKNLSQCAFKKDKLGKPFLENYPKCHISISHCNGYVWTVISNSPIGIDFEKIELGCVNDLRIAFDNEDWENICYNPELIFEYFSLKESYLKMLGMGFTKEPSEIKIYTLKDNIHTEIFDTSNDKFIFTLILKNFKPGNYFKSNKIFSKLQNE